MSFNKEQGTIACWAKNSIVRPIHHWKLDEVSDRVVMYAGTESGTIPWDWDDYILVGSGTVTRGTPGLHGTAGCLRGNVTAASSDRAYAYKDIIPITTGKVSASCYININGLRNF